jgi:CRP-like cAMP-binding protein
MKREEIARILQALPGLQDVAPRLLQSMAGHFERQVVHGQPLCREGEEADALYVLTAGQLDVYKRSDQGNDRLVAHLYPVTLVGTVAVVTGGRRTATVMAPTWAELLVMPAPVVRELLETWDFEVASPLRRAIIVATAGQLSQANRTIGALAVELGLAEVAPGPLTHDLVAAARPMELPANPSDPEAVEQALLKARAGV